MRHQPEEELDQAPNTVRIFVIVAIVTLIPLLLFARLASGEARPKPQPVSQGADGASADLSTTSLSLAPSEPQIARRLEFLAPPPDVAAESYEVFDRVCGDRLFAKNEHQRLPPASLTKIVTAMVVRSRAGLDDVVSVNVSGKRMAAKGSSVMGIEPGMQLSVRDLLYGLFLASGNDAAEALAQHVAGSNEGFAVLMNQKVRELGMSDTRFTNPHGLDDVNLYSTAGDMMLAGLAFLKDPVLAEISSAPTYTPNWKGPELKNGNRLLVTYPGSFGVKIGFTDKAHQTMVAAAQRDGRQILVSLFKSDDRYADTQALLDWAFINSRPSC